MAEKTFKMDWHCCKKTLQQKHKICKDPFYLCKHLTQRNRVGFSACHILICEEHRQLCKDCKDTICSFCAIKCSVCGGSTCSTIAKCSICQVQFCNDCATGYQTCSECKDLLCSACLRKPTHTRICNGTQARSIDVENSGPAPKKQKTETESVSVISVTEEQ